MSTKTITHLTSLSDLESAIKTAKSKHSGNLVIDFHATWCGPCHAIAPRYESFSKQYPNVMFAKCDVDAAQDVAQKYSVSAMPTFVLLKDGNKFDQVRGADPNGLERAIKGLAGGGAGSSAPGSFSGKGQSLSGGSASGFASDASRASPLGNMDLQTQIFAALVVFYVVYVFLG